MKITVCVIGSRGDVQPTIALSRGLKAAGHDVRLFTHEMFEDLVTGHGVDFVPLPGDPKQSLITTAAVELGNNPIRLMRWFRQNFRPVLRDLFERTLEVVEGSDLIISSSLSIAAFHVGERLGIPVISTQLQPTTLTRAFPSAIIPLPPEWLPFKSLYNVAVTKFGNQATFQMLRPLTNECREEVLDLPRLGPGYWWKVDSPDNDIPMIYAYSPSVLPRPDDWGPYKQVSGYWFLDRPAAFDPPDGLARFLEEGPPPVYVSFGSMIDHERDEVTRLVIEAVERAGQRAILHTGWSELGSDSLPKSVIVVDEVPHDWLFPQLAAVVHHGGAGTTAAGLRAGLPTVIVAFFGDQFFWGWRVRELGVGPRWITRKKLQVDNLAEAIRMAVYDEGMRRRAAALGERIRAEEGVANAVSMIERYAATGRIDALST